jgi:outer membrane protein
VDLVASRQFNRSPTSIVPPEVGTTSTNAIGVQLSVPIFSGGYTSSTVREAIALEDKAASDLEASRRTAALNVRQSFVGVVSGLSQIKALEAAALSSESSLESNKLGYKLGVRINIDVLNAQQQVFSTQRDLAKARYDTLMNSLKLKSAAGTLKEEDLQLMNALLEH